MTTWADVNVGDVVVGKDGAGWTVTALANKPKTKERKASIERGAKAFEVTVPADRDVVVLERAAPAIPGVDPSDLAAAVVTSTIGGEVILEAHAGDPFPKAPKRFAAPGSLFAHLYVMHGIRELPTVGEAEDFHDAHHANAAGAPGYNDHDHVL